MGEGAQEMGATACWGLLLAWRNRCFPNNHITGCHPGAGWGVFRGRGGECVCGGVVMAYGLWSEFQGSWEERIVLRSR